MLGVARGAVNVGAGLGRLRREVHSGVVDTDSMPDVQIIAPLEEIFSKNRAIKAPILFLTLNPIYSKKIYDKAAKYHLENGGCVVTFIVYIEQVARQFSLTIAACGGQAANRLVRH